MGKGNEPHGHIVTVSLSLQSLINPMFKKCTCTDVLRVEINGSRSPKKPSIHTGDMLFKSYQLPLLPHINYIKQDKKGVSRILATIHRLCSGGLGK